MTTLHSIGECEAIRRLARLLPSRGDVRVSIGDDAAVVKTAGPHDLLLTSDAVIEGTHFLPKESPDRVGHKAIGRALSDLAAAGGEPLWALVDIVAPPSTDIARLEIIYRGLSRLAARFNLAVVGGDMAQGPVLELHVFAVGRVPKGQALLRSGARPGDSVYVTGSLGGSLLGKHLTFEPRMREGLFLRAGRWASAAIDISDGLATDLSHVLKQSEVGAEIETAALPISSASKKSRDKKTPLEHALFDGEDFELLFTVRANKTRAFEASWRKRLPAKLTRIGRITRPPRALTLVFPDGKKAPLTAAGFEHFR